ncbi:MAG: hypothetical protein JJU05_09420 [Verrucomicrobia bacterium]|nr:hypothetical protein [Verrucomicrobiota bacterium]MCH8526029.1 hypothetical protein [Kiritimatiellia bacterium]
MQISPHQDLTFEPFSRFGSYLSLSRLTNHKRPHFGPGLYLRQHHGVQFAVHELALLLLDGQEPESEWDAARLTLRTPGGSGQVEILFDGTEALRLRGRGVSLSLCIPPIYHASMYPARGGDWEINSRGSASKILLHVLAGKLEALTDWQGEASETIEARLSADTPEGEWELALDHFHGTWTPRTYSPFEEVEAATRADFSEWLAKIPQASPELAEARVRAAYVNWSSTVRPHGHFRRHAMLMSKNHMDFVWSWDHAFNAMAHMRGTPDFAWDQMMLMADRQDIHGAFPDQQNDGIEHFSFCKPPIHGWALSKLRATRPDFFDAPRLREALSWLEPWTRWWLNHRVWEDGGLPYYLHGNDSGWDNSTFFLKGVPVLTPDLPCFLVLQCRELAAIHRILGQNVDAEFWSTRADQLRATVLRELWNGERFVAKHLPSGEFVEADTLIETIPLVLGGELPTDIRAKVVSRLHRYLTPHGLATEWPESPHYTPDGYWRGPIWAPSTCLIVDGLRRSGETALADDIANRFLRMCAASGFSENFDALTGAPLRDKAYTWTSSVFLLLAAGQ